MTHIFYVYASRLYGQSIMQAIENRKHTMLINAKHVYTPVHSTTLHYKNNKKIVLQNVDSLLSWRQHTGKRDKCKGEWCMQFCVSLARNNAINDDKTKPEAIHLTFLAERRIIFLFTLSLFRLFSFVFVSVAFLRFTKVYYVCMHLFS